MSTAMRRAAAGADQPATKQITFLCPTDIVAQIEHLAHSEHRRVGPQVVFLLEQALGRREQPRPDGSSA